MSRREAISMVACCFLSLALTVVFIIAMFPGVLK
jgi:hypothetical protein